MDEILRQQSAQPANSCNSENGVSFLDQVITPLYEVVAAVSVIVHKSECNLLSFVLYLCSYLIA